MPYTKEQNILSLLCFRLGLGAAVAATVLSAAEVPDRPQQLTRVVRVDPRTGKLVRSVIVTSKPVAHAAVAAPAAVSHSVSAAPVSKPAPSPQALHDAVDRVAAQEALPPVLVHSVIKAESNYNPMAVSPKGAMGLMQLMPDTARRFGVTDIFDPLDNLQGGARYLHYLLDLYNGNYTLAVAAYNAGEAAVDKYGSVPPFTETRNYVVQVRRNIERSLQTGRPIPPSAGPAAVAPQPSTVAPAVTEEAPHHIQEIVGTDGIVRYVVR